MPITHFLRKGGQFVTGVAIKKSLETGFDYILYPAVLTWLGYFYGGVTMTMLAILLNIGIIRAYDWAKVDWLFIEEIKRVRDDQSLQLPGILNYLKPFFRKGDIFAFFVLCVDDPVTVVLYLRKGSNLFNGLTFRDWWIFGAANLVANLYWIGALVAVIELIKGVFY